MIILNLIILLIMSISDFKTMIVSDKLMIIFLVISLIQVEQIGSVIFALCLYILFYIYFNFISKYIGGADLKLICIFIILESVATIYIIFIASLTCMLYSFVFNKTKVYFIPFLSLGYFLRSLWEILI